MTGYINPDGSALVGAVMTTGRGQALAIDAQGNLQVSQQVGGSPISMGNPEINIDQIRSYILAGQGFSGTTGKVTAGVSGSAQLFSAANATKNLLIYSIRMSYSNATQIGLVQLITAQDANMTTLAAMTNFKVGGPAPAATTSMTYTSANAGGVTGTAFDTISTVAQNETEVMQPMNCILVPAGLASGGGVAVYLATTAAGNFTVNFKWIEF
jgi:hypothetical protein